MLVKNAVSLFLLSLDGSKSPQTVTWYQRRLHPLVASLGDTPLETVTIADLRRLRADLSSRSTRYEDHPYRPVVNGRGLSPYTIHGHLRAIRRLFHWLLDEEIISTNPTERLELPRLPQTPRRGLDPADVQKIIQAATHPRDLALTYFLASTACRLSGLASLRLTDLDLSTGRAVVREKGGKSRPVYLTPPAVGAMRAWLELRPTVTHPYVFTSQFNPYNPLTPAGIYRVIQRLASRAGVERGWNPHNWRHGAARAMLKNGANLAEVSQILGHNSITVTADFYATFADDELREAALRTSWVSAS